MDDVQIIVRQLWQTSIIPQILSYFLQKLKKINILWITIFLSIKYYTLLPTILGDRIYKLCKLKSTYDYEQLF